MSISSLISILLGILLVTMSGVCLADSNKTYYNGYAFDSELVPSGMIPYEDGWSHGALFSAPNWLLAQLDKDLMSSVLDRGVTPTPTPVIPDDQYESDIASGYAALEAGNYRDAYTAFKAATILEPSSSDAWYGLGISLEKQSRLLSALDAYSKAIVLSNEPATDWASYAGKGRVLFDLNRLSEAQYALSTAKSHYEKAGVSHPDELEEINRLLNEIQQKLGITNTG